MVSAAGIWNGTLSSGRDMRALILDPGEYYTIYSRNSSPSAAGGMVQGNGSSVVDQFRPSNGLGFNFEGVGVIKRSLSATVEFQTPLTGIVTADSGSSNPNDFTSMFDPLRSQAASLATVAPNISRR